MNLINLSDLSKEDIKNIWAIAEQPINPLSGYVAWSFEGNGIRTRTSFLQGFRALGLDYIELPNLLKTSERVEDLAGYLDDYYEAYVIRESNHERLSAFANASKRPVVNAMSSEGHPCEVLADAYYLETEFGKLEDVKLGLWGPPTNVFKSWHHLAQVFGFTIWHYCDIEFHSSIQNVVFSDELLNPIDVLITDGWSKDYKNTKWSLTLEHLNQLGKPKLLPVPPFTIGQEVSFDPVNNAAFVGYGQKKLLLNTQQAILLFLLRSKNIRG